MPDKDLVVSTHEENKCIPLPEEVDAVPEPSSAFLDYIVKNFRKNLKKKVPVELELEGIFKCEEKEHEKYETEEAKIELIGRKTLKFLSDAGYNEDKIYDISTLMDGETLEKELKSVVYAAVKMGKIGHSKMVISQMFQVFELGNKKLVNLLFKITGVGVF